MFNIGMDADKIGKVANMIDTVSVTLKTDVHINDLMRAANTVITAEFVKHMSQVSVDNQNKFGHMYEWGMVGNPAGRLWKHVLRGRGASRQLSFDFKASQKTVPVAPELAEIGVKNIHIFQWKAPVMELGRPVSISPKLAKMLVFLAKETKRGANSTGHGFSVDGRVFYKGTINISRAGSQEAWGSFTGEFNSWFRSGMPEQFIRSLITPGINRAVKNSILERIRRLSATRERPKTITLEPVGIDKSFEATLAASLHTNYIAAAASRRAFIADDEV